MKEELRLRREARNARLEEDFEGEQFSLLFWRQAVVLRFRRRRRNIKRRRRRIGEKSAGILFRKAGPTVK